MAESPPPTVIQLRDVLNGLAESLRSSRVAVSNEDLFALDIARGLTTNLIEMYPALTTGADGQRWTEETMDAETKEATTRDGRSAERLAWILKEIENRAGMVNRALQGSSSGYGKTDPEVAFIRAFDKLAQERGWR